MAADETLFTVGHSNHDLPTFLALLTKHSITAIADVRSRPSSRKPHFNRDRLAAALGDAGIEYIFLGDELGARRIEPQCYVDGRADYERIAELPAFQAGLNRVRAELKRGRLCLLCAEKEPLDCHRTILVCRRLRAPGLDIRHILADGKAEEHSDTEIRLLKKTGVKPTLFQANSSPDELLNQAYETRGRRIAYRGLAPVATGPDSIRAWRQ